MTDRGATAIHHDPAHAVHLYEGEQHRAAAAAAYLHAGLVEGQTAIVIATKEHASAIDELLAERGLDLLDLRSRGALTTMDADATLHSLSDGTGEIDRTRFEQAVAHLLDGISKATVPTRIYGEMVTMLWIRGHITAALALETFWNDALQGLDASVFCAYPATLLGDAEREPLSDLYHAHTEVLGRSCSPSGPLTDEVQRAFTPHPRAAAEARRFAAGALAQIGQEEHAAETTLVVSELATNAMLHAASPFVVTLGRADGMLRIVVEDHSGRAPLFGHRPRSDESGRGLALIDAIAARWGVQRTQDGKRVWVDLKI